MRTLILCLGHKSCAAAFFEDHCIVEVHTVKTSPFPAQKIEEWIKQPLSSVLVSAEVKEEELLTAAILKKAGINFQIVKPEKRSLRIDPYAPVDLGNARLAAMYGALYNHPGKDCIIITIDRVVSIDCITKDRYFLGGALLPDIELQRYALSENIANMPLVESIKPSSYLGQSKQKSVQSGLYYGFLGSLEKMISLYKKGHVDLEAIVIATGCFFEKMAGSHDLAKDIEKIVDYFEPDLIYLGLEQMRIEKL